jgi:hypothetical protein
MFGNYERYVTRVEFSYQFVEYNYGSGNKARSDLPESKISFLDNFLRIRDFFTQYDVNVTSKYCFEHKGGGFVYVAVYVEQLAKKTQALVITSYFHTFPESHRLTHLDKGL